jgi:acyl-CoA synthetase (AMP-forming)/AMP-acid ligase II
MSDQAQDRISLADILKPSSGQLKNLHRVGRGIRMIASARFKEQLSIGQLIEKHARKHPDRLALKFENRVYSYSAFNAEANRIAHVLKRADVRAGDTVAVLVDNRPETLFAVTAIVKLGATAAMCNTKQRGEVLAHSLKTVKPAAAIVGTELVDAFDEVREQAGLADRDRVWFVGEPGRNKVPAGYRDLFSEAATRPGANPPETQQVTKGQACFYIFTSGTTGMPKASVMSHGRWVKGGAGMGLTGMRLTADDALYCCLPLYHNNALTVSWGGVVTAGAALVLARKFSASGFWDDVRAQKATAFCYIGELCRYMLRQPASDADRQHRVRVIVGNGLRPDIWDEFKQRFGIEHICEFYGASEGNLVFINGFNMDRTAGFCPLPFAVVECDMETEEPVRGADGHLKKVGPGQVGLLITKITDMAPFEGYTDDAASEKKLLNDAFESGDSYFNTGDLVRDQGMRHIAFVDRLGDTFRWKGENVATTEVEKGLNAHPDIEESVVYGVEVPGADGRAGMAAITPRQDLNSVDWADLTRHLKGELPAYAVPVFLRSRPEQEVTGTFKYRKVELKKEGYSPEGDEPVYVLLPGEAAYQPLDDDLRQKISAGEIKL